MLSSAEVSDNTFQAPVKSPAPSTARRLSNKHLTRKSELKWSLRSSRASIFVFERGQTPEEEHRAFYRIQDGVDYNFNISFFSLQVFSISMFLGGGGGFT